MAVAAMTFVGASLASAKYATQLCAGVLTALSGQVRLVCSNLGLDCLYDLAGVEFEVNAGHLTANETGVTELGGKFFCPKEGLLEALLET